MSVADEDSVRTALMRAIADYVAALDEGGTLTIAEFATVGITVWSLHRDQAGTPHHRIRPAIPWSSLYNGSGSPSERELARLARADAGSPFILVRSSPEGLRSPQGRHDGSSLEGRDSPESRHAPEGHYAADAFARLRAAYPDAPSFHYVGPLSDLLSHVLAHDPLTRSYELVVLRQTRSGKLVLAGCQLFPHGAGPGCRETFTIRIEPSNGSGTVFAVFTTEPARRFRLVSTASADLDPGVYTVTAELRGPGRVRFDGLPRPLREDRRGWPELIAMVPDRLAAPRPVHLVCAVEVSGAGARVAERISRVEQLIGTVADQARDEIRISVISYGSHSFDRGAPEVPPAVRLWAGTGDEALVALGRLAETDVVDTGYPKAAQLECVLMLLAGRLDARRGRPVVVTVGARPAHPWRVDPVTEILPCPRRNDWRRALRHLRDFPGMAFGAIHEQSADEEFWADLGNEARARVDAVDLRRFACDLGLIGAGAHYVPFPVADG